MIVLLFGFNEKSESSFHVNTISINNRQNNCSQLKVVSQEGGTGKKKAASKDGAFSYSSILIQQFFSWKGR